VSTEDDHRRIRGEKPFVQFPMQKNYVLANDGAMNWRIVRDRVGNIPTEKTNRPRAAKVP
jgi:NADH:ubiquinone oxidoreductase subunit C